MTPDTITLLCDSREPWPHPWQRWLPSHVLLERATLDTGDFALAGLADGAVVERKTVSDFLACMTSNRERFERELARSRHVGRFVVIVEGTLADCISARGDMTEASLIGTVAAWSRRYCPILFAGDERTAADLCLRFLAGQLVEAERVVKAVDGGGQLGTSSESIEREGRAAIADTPKRSEHNTTTQVSRLR
jgi:ERCC4-type nuclease